MTKNELITSIAKKVDDEFTHAQLNEAIGVILETITAAVCAGERVEIRGLGTFSRRQWGPRHARNPYTKKSWMTEPKAAIHFKPGKTLKELVNQAL